MALLQKSIMMVVSLICIIKSDTECPNNTSFPATICPSSSQGCCEYQYSNNGYGCKMPIVGQSSGSYCCAPGPLLNASNTLPNVMILGDSVSIGFTSHVVANLSKQAMVQHSPWYTLYHHHILYI